MIRTLWERELRRSLESFELRIEGAKGGLVASEQFCDSRSAFSWARNACPCFIAAFRLSFCANFKKFTRTSTVQVKRILKKVLKLLLERKRPNQRLLRMKRGSSLFSVE